MHPACKLDRNTHSLSLAQGRQNDHPCTVRAPLKSLNHCFSVPHQNSCFEFPSLSPSLSLSLSLSLLSLTISLSGEEPMVSNANNLKRRMYPIEQAAKLRQTGLWFMARYLKQSIKFCGGQNKLAEKPPHIIFIYMRFPIFNSWLDNLGATNIFCQDVT